MLLAGFAVHRGKRRDGLHSQRLELVIVEPFGMAEYSKPFSIQTQDVGQGVRMLTSMRIITKFDSTKRCFHFQEDVVQYEEVLPVVNPGQTCDDFLVIWRVVPTNCDGRSCTISHLHHQRICTSSLRSRSATSASCLLSTELTEIDPSSRVVSLIFVAMPPAVCVYVCIINLQLLQQSQPHLQQ